MVSVCDGDWVVKIVYVVCTLLSSQLLSGSASGDLILSWPQHTHINLDFVLFFFSTHVRAYVNVVLIVGQGNFPLSESSGRLSL